MIGKSLTKRQELFIEFSSLVFLFLIYAYLSYNQHIVNPKDTTIPNLYQFLDVWNLNTPWFSTLWITIKRHLIAVSISCLISIVFGILMGCFPVVDAFLKHPVTIFGALPATAMSAIYFVILHKEEKFYYWTIAIGIVPALLLAIRNSVVKDISEYLIHKTFTLGGSRAEVIYEVIFRKILPRIINNIRPQIGLAMVLLIPAEVYAADWGVGAAFRKEFKSQRMAIVYTYTAILGLYGFLFDQLLIKLRRKLCPWFGD